MGREYFEQQQSAENDDNDSGMQTLDSDGKQLQNGDSVRLTRDLKVGGASMKLKRGDVLQKISLIDGDVENVECRVGKSTLVVKTMYLKKA